jgi:hypothetical protein
MTNDMSNIEVRNVGDIVSDMGIDDDMDDYEPMSSEDEDLFVFIEEMIRLGKMKRENVYASFHDYRNWERNRGGYNSISL